MTGQCPYCYTDMHNQRYCPGCGRDTNDYTGEYHNKTMANEASSNIKKSKEELMSIQQAYLSDQKIQQWHQKIADIYMKAVPEGFIYKDGSYNISYGDNVENHVALIRMEMKAYIKQAYPNLFNP
jgi:hypothetical protein